MKTLTAVATLLGLVGSCYGFHAEEQDGRLRVEVFAPDWTWQVKTPESRSGAAIHVLVNIENISDATAYVYLAYTTAFTDSHAFPFDRKEAVRFDGTNSNPAPKTVYHVMRFGPGQRERIALPTIYPLDILPVGEYEFAVEIGYDNGRGISLLFPIRTIRGAAVSDGLWAKLLPAAIGLAWCGVVTFFMRQYMRPGTWRRTFAPEAGEAE